MSGMRFTPKGYGGHAATPTRSSATAGRNRVCWPSRVDDERLTWPERELVRQLGEKLYGKLPAVREVRHD